MSPNIIAVSDTDFEQNVLNAEIPVLVDFWAEWCGPCKMLNPILEEVAATYAGKLQIAKINVDQSQQTPAQYGIRGIPTLILFKAGAAIETKVGMLTKSQLTSFIDSHL